MTGKCSTQNVKKRSAAIEKERAVQEKITSLDLLPAKNDERCCGTCEHCFRKDKADCCRVLFEEPVVTNEVCDAWNSGEIENTWNFLVYPVKNVLSILIKENDMEIARKEIKMPVKSVDAVVIDMFKTATLEKGCPDFVCNLAPQKYASGQVKKWLDYRIIKYRELDAGISEMKIMVDGDVTVSEVLSTMIDAALNFYDEGSEPDNGK
jgi:hypothetical protein